MARTRHESRQQRLARFEQFEQRLCMSAQAVASILPELEIASPAVTQQVVSHPLLNNVSPTTEAAKIAAEYGFDGAGQTVAVIDTGIAWDHYALGGGFGVGNKVVGGWDFAENDANPYDDGPAGFHGSHVAGIIGSTDAQYKGVSSGVDLVALRVFDDNGGGNLKWVEQALQWVHDHKDDFANPITTVNLSLGTEWNGFTTPEWATLEDEFAQLEADGLFISVAAGNSFQSYGKAGLSYPAVSDHVVPVASHDAHGNISDFSQRASNVLVAPGESIKSSVPDHLFGGTSKGRFLGSTGTSMAAPYVAGASAILRQANQFMGVENINQDMLYEQFRQTADQIYDSVTKGYYYKINLEAALASVVTDLNDDTAATATNLGVLNDGAKITGTIGTSSDVDHFSFKSTMTGTVRMRLDATHDLGPLVNVIGSDAQIKGNEITFSVEAGKNYSFSIGSNAGIGHYTLDVTCEIGNPATNWGTIVSQEFSNQTISGESMFKMKAARDGFLTVQTSGNASAVASNGAMKFEIYDSQMNLVATRSVSSSELRLDIVASQGETYYLKAIGNATNLDFHVDNLVSLKSGQLIVNGTNQNDVITVDASNGFAIQVNGTDYQFTQSQVQRVTVNGHGGSDSFDLQMGALNDNVQVRSDGLYAQNSDFVLWAGGVEEISVDAGSGWDAVSLVGTSGDDLLVASASSVALSGVGYSNHATGFDYVKAMSSGGYDNAALKGTELNDWLRSRDGQQAMLTGSTWIVVDQFEWVTVDGGGGNDTAQLYGTAGNDHFDLRSTTAYEGNSNSRMWASGFETVNAFSRGGNDSVVMRDSKNDDVFSFNHNTATITGVGFRNVANGFSKITVNATTGYDIARFVDTAGNDLFTSDGTTAKFLSANYSVTAVGFDFVDVVSRYGGFDKAILVGTAGTDFLHANENSVTLNDSNQRKSRVIGFDKVAADLGDGVDYATLKGSQNNEKLRANYSDIEFETTLQLLQMKNADHTKFDGNGGTDQVTLGELDLLSALGDKAKGLMKNHTVTVEEFSVLEARSVDNAIAEYDLEAVDFQYMLSGAWIKK